MGKRRYRLRGLLLVVAMASSACGGDDENIPDTSDIEQLQTTTTSEPEPTEPEPTEPEPTEPEADDSGEAEPPGGGDSVMFTSLAEGQQRIVGGICEATEASKLGTFSWAPEWVLSVLIGEAGVPALEAAFTEIGQVQDPAAYLEVSGPICEEIGWVPGS